MSYRDRQQRASIGGVYFHQLTEKDAGGIKGPTHLFPGSDLQFPEEQGAAEETMTITGFLIGDDYDREKRHLKQVLSQPGPLRFVSFFGGEYLVTVRNRTFDQDALRQGSADFALQLTIWNEPPGPDAGIDPDAGIRARAEPLRKAAIADFAAVISLDGLADSLVLDALGLAQSALDLFDGVLRFVDQTGRAAADMTRDLDDLGDSLLSGGLDDPEAFADGVFGLAEGLSVALPDPDPLDQIGGFDPASPVLQQLTPARRQQQRNREAIGSLARRAGLYSHALALQGRDFTAREDAKAALDLMDARLEAEQTRAGGVESWNDAVFSAFGALRGACRHAMTLRGANLAWLRTEAQAVAVPAQLVAWRLYGDVTRADEITDRNSVKHPGLISGNLTVLDR